MPQLILYYTPGCPYCLRVLDFMKKKNIELPLKDASDQATRQELRTIGGKTQVPCLVIDGRAMYESMDIIQWLEVNFKK